MANRRRALTTGGVLFAALLFSISYTTAQDTSPILTTLLYFGGGSAGEYPYGGVVIGKSGVLYGTTASGGSLDLGTVFSLAPPASPGGAWTESVLHNFTGGGDGAVPYAGVVIGSGGVLYGATPAGGGSSDFGTVFALTPPASPGGAWTETVLHAFTGGRNGAYPYGNIAIGKSGVLYGTTAHGGSSCCGTVFSLAPPASPGGDWTETVLHDFTGGSDGTDPYAGVAIGSGGVLYGTTYAGGSLGAGTVFALTPPASPGDPWAETILLNFSVAHPYGSVVIGNNGVLYSTTSAGGNSGNGSVFSLTPPASPGGQWTETVLHSFAGGTDGASPFAGVAIGSAGVLYGTTEFTAFSLKL